MECYIINLKDEKKRFLHTINEIRKIFPNLTINKIDAIDGEKTTEGELYDNFNLKKYLKTNLWNITKEEIGCVLSHRECYFRLCSSKSEWGLILEDDIKITGNIHPIFKILEKKLDSNTPQIILFSGWYWYTSKKRIENNFYLCKIYDARLAHAYLINKKSAEIILREKPWYIADHWDKYKKMGINILAIKPHLIDQINNSHFKSSIQKGKPVIYHFGIKKWLTLKKQGIIRRFLKYILGNFENKHNC